MRDCTKGHSIRKLEKLCNIWIIRDIVRGLPKRKRHWEGKASEESHTTGGGQRLI